MGWKFLSSTVYFIAYASQIHFQHYNQTGNVQNYELISQNIFRDVLVGGIPKFCHIEETFAIE